MNLCNFDQTGHSELLEQAYVIAQTSTHGSLTLEKLLIAISSYIYNANRVIGIGIFGMHRGMR